MLSMSVSTNIWAERNKYALEKFDMSDLVLTNTWSVRNVKIATVIDNEGYLYRVIEGDYMEKNYGKVKTIGNDKIKICDLDLALSEKTKRSVENCYWIYKKEFECDQSGCSYR